MRSSYVLGEAVAAILIRTDLLSEPCCTGVISRLFRLSSGSPRKFTLGTFPFQVDRWQTCRCCLDGSLHCLFLLSLYCNHTYCRRQHYGNKSVKLQSHSRDKWKDTCCIHNDDHYSYNILHVDSHWNIQRTDKRLLGWMHLFNSTGTAGTAASSILLMSMS